MVTEMGAQVLKLETQLNVMECKNREIMNINESLESTIEKYSLENSQTLEKERFTKSKIEDLKLDLVAKSQQIEELQILVKHEQLELKQ